MRISEGKNGHGQSHSTNIKSQGCLKMSCGSELQKSHLNHKLGTDKLSKVKVTSPRLKVKEA